MYGFFSKKKQVLKNKIEPTLYIDTVVDGFSDHEIRTLTVVSMRYASLFKEEQDPVTQDFILSYDIYKNTTFEEKLNYLLVTMGNLFIAENTKRKLKNISDKITIS